MAREVPPHPNPLPQGGEGDSQPTADQQVRPTIATGSITAAIKTATGKIKERISGSLTTAATKAPVRELSPYDKAILEGKTHLEAMYAQYTPVKNTQPKPKGDSSSPKPNPLDAFSEPVKPYPFASLHGLLRRGSLWGSMLG